MESLLNISSSCVVSITCTLQWLSYCSIRLLYSQITMNLYLYKNLDYYSIVSCLALPTLEIVSYLNVFHILRTSAGLICFIHFEISDNSSWVSSAIDLPFHDLFSFHFKSEKYSSIGDIAQVNLQGDSKHKLQYLLNSSLRSGKYGIWHCQE